MIVQAQAGWYVLVHVVIVSHDSVPPAHFYELPIVAWRTDKAGLIPMTVEPIDLNLPYGVLAPDGKVSGWDRTDRLTRYMTRSGHGDRLSRATYEKLVIDNDPDVRAEVERREAAKRESEASAKYAQMASL